MKIKRTKIGATIGPSSESPAVLKDLAKAGMDFARLNFSHGTYEWHQKSINSLRALEKEIGRPLAIMQDIQGPKIRLGILPEKGVEVKVGQSLIFCEEKSKGAKCAIPLGFSGLGKFLHPGERMLIDDGRVEVKVKKVTAGQIEAQVTEGGLLTSHKGLNFPDSKIAIPVLSDKDKADLEFGIKMGVDVVALSFVSRAQDILDVKFLLRDLAHKHKQSNLPPIAVYAKIERHEAVTNIDEIIDAVDGIMIARGDLGLEMEPSEVPLVQKRLIDKANLKAKPVIVATQMLDSMREKMRPTRAEVSDVANAVIDHADALLLTNETAVGKYPALATKTMHKIILATEKSVYDNKELVLPTEKVAVDAAIANLSRLLAEEVDAKLILAASLSGETGRLLSRVRSELPIFVATGTQRVWRQLNLAWGVNSFILPPCHSVEELVERSLSYIKQQKIAKTGDKMLIVAGEPVGQAGNVNLVEVREIK